jgi:hypothetical protein
MAAAASVDGFRASCLCGAVQHTMRGKPLAIVVCHCTNCQIWSGAPFLHTVAWRTADVEQTGAEKGEMKSFLGETEELDRRTCVKCGGHAGHVVAAHGMTAFHLAAIADAFVQVDGGKRTYRDVFRPQCHLFYGSRVVDVVDGAPKMAKKAPADGMLAEE